MSQPIVRCVLFVFYLIPFLHRRIAGSVDFVQYGSSRPQLKRSIHVSFHSLCFSFSRQAALLKTTFEADCCLVIISGGQLHDILSQLVLYLVFFFWFC